MKLKKALQEHHRFQPSGSLPDNLGDGFLFQHNPVFRNIRNAALDAGVRFSPLRFESYDVLPLTQLPKILESKTVPYAPNVKPLEEIESKIPDHFILSQLPPLKANYVLHESAHVLARQIRVQHLGELKLDSDSVTRSNKAEQLAKERRLALAVLLEEAFANAAESLLSLASNSIIHDQFLLKNAYVHEIPEMRKVLRNSVSRFGFDSVFRLVLLSFLHANLLKTKFNQRDFDRILRYVLKVDQKKISSLDPKFLRELKVAYMGGFDLDPLFTGLTNRFCLRFMGIKTELTHLFQFDFMQVIETDSGFTSMIDSLTRVISE